MTTVDEYPSARAALFDSDKLVNFRCFLKYILWHGAYILLAIVGVLLYAGAVVFDRLSRSGGNRAVGAVQSGVSDPRVKKVSRWAFGILAVLYIGIVLAYGAYLLYQALLAAPLLTVAAIVGVVVGVAAIIVGWAYGGPYVKRAIYRTGGAVASGASRAGAVAQQTPGIRRVYGECPVSFDIEPKWFDRIFDDS